MALNLPVFYKRTASAIVFAAVMLCGLLTNKVAFLALITVIDILCLRDFFRLLKKIQPDSNWPDWLPVTVQIMGVSLIAYTFGCLYLILPWDNMIGTGAVVLLIPAVLIIVGTLSAGNLLSALLQSLAGIFYITLPMIFLLMMERTDYLLPVALILMIWTNDTMAYLVGSFIGKTPFSAISPKKTWEGTAGGALLTMGGAMLYGYFSHKYRMIDWAALALCAGVAGTLGDLVESKLKRMADVKDSGTLMPGHGGALDRFDSLLLAAPFACAYLCCFM